MIAETILGQKVSLLYLLMLVCSGPKAVSCAGFCVLQRLLVLNVDLKRVFVIGYFFCWPLLNEDNLESEAVYLSSFSK